MTITEEAEMIRKGQARLISGRNREVSYCKKCQGMNFIEDGKCQCGEDKIELEKTDENSESKETPEGNCS